MKKNIFNWMTIALMAFAVCAGFAACGGDDDDDVSGTPSGNNGSGNNGNNSANVLVGTWYCSWDTDDSVGNDTYVFRADGTGYEKGSNHFKKDGYSETWNEKFRYSIVSYDASLGTGKAHQIFDDGSGGSYDFKKISGDLLQYRYYHLVFVKQ